MMERYDQIKTNGTSKLALRIKAHNPYRPYHYYSRTTCEPNEAAEGTLGSTRAASLLMISPSTSRLTSAL